MAIMQEIETKYKMPIPTMFKVHGEDWFRQKEKEMVAYWAHQKNESKFYPFLI